MATTETTAEGGGALRSSRARYLRDSAVFDERQRGVPVAETMSRYGLSEAAVHRICRTWRTDGLSSVDALDPAAVVREQLADYAQARRDLAALQSRTNHEGIELAAITRKLEVAERRFDLLQRLGALPANPGAIRLDHELQLLGRVFKEAFERHADSVSEEFMSDYLAAIAATRAAIMAKPQWLTTVEPPSLALDPSA